jgi:hypothetical protein
MTMLAILGVAAAQWLVFISISAFSRSKHPKSGLRTSEKNLLVSTGFLFVVWLAAFDAGALVSAKPKIDAAAAVTATAHGTATCAALQTGMKVSEVQTKLGKADEIRSDDNARGPGAVTWIYRDSRCAVHLLDDKVELVE